MGEGGEEGRVGRRQGEVSKGEGECQTGREEGDGQLLGVRRMCVCVCEVKFCVVCIHNLDCYVLSSNFGPRTSLELCGVACPPSPTHGFQRRELLSRLELCIQQHELLRLSGVSC